MAISAQYKSKFEAIHSSWWRHHECKILEWDKKNRKQTNKIHQTLAQGHMCVEYVIKNICMQHLRTLLNFNKQLLQNYKYV